MKASDKHGVKKESVGALLPMEEFDQYLFHEGTHYQSWRLMGAHITAVDGVRGVRFTLWAPEARKIYVVGDFNQWDGAMHPMDRISGHGIWSVFIPGVSADAHYKYEIHTHYGGVLVKSDPYAFYSEVRPKSASIVTPLEGYVWHDEEWQAAKKTGISYERPMLIYEVHLGSWRRKENNRSLTYVELAEELVEYAADLGYTHIEILPLAEHPFDGSWGYQATGYYSVTSRYGTPHEFMHFVDCCHQKGLGVIMDWVPGHFCQDGHGLMMFDGTPVYEYKELQRAVNYGWGTRNFDLGRPEVKSFLISNALFWFQLYHIDGLRVDAVASMIYRDYGKKHGEWSLNQHGGRENLEGVAFLQQLNAAVFAKEPYALMMAEESTAWPLVTKPTYLGGLGFNYKWNMGWMNDMLKYMSLDPIHRRWQHKLVTFSLMYAFSENFVLPLSHDEVVHGKKSLLNKMPGDYWQKFANLRLFYGYMMAHPGKKLLFMGGEFGQFIEWKDDDSLDWHLLDYEKHKQLHQYVKDLNHFYRKWDMLWQIDNHWDGFQWIDCSDYDQSVVAMLRQDKKGNFLIVVCNFTPIVRYGYRIGVPEQGLYKEVLNSDRGEYGGSDVWNWQEIRSIQQEWHGFSYSVELTLPPLATVFFTWAGDEKEVSE